MKRIWVLLWILAVAGFVASVHIEPLYGQQQFRTCTSAHGSFTQPANLTQSTVQTSVTNASDGDVVCLPAGSATWTAQITINTLSSRTKMVAIQGAGSGSNPVSNTVITANNTSTFVDGGDTCCAVFDVHLNNTLTGFELSNIRLVQGGNWDSSDEEAVWGFRLTGNADSSGSQIRIHHMYFEWSTAHLGTAGNADDRYGNIVNVGRIGGNFGQHATFETTHAYIWGVIDHNTLHGAGSFQCWDVLPKSARTFTGPNGSIGEGTVAGMFASEEPIADHWNSRKALFMEDNTITADKWQNNNACGDGQAGSVQIWRHNVLRNVWFGTHGYELDVASKWNEVHDNDFILDSSDSDYTSPGDIRGGTEVFYNNHFYDSSHKGSYTINGSEIWDDFAELIYYRAANPCSSNCGPNPCSKSMADFTTPLGCDMRTITSGSQKGYPGGWQPCTRFNNAQPTWQWNFDWAVEPCVAWGNTYGPSTATVVWAAFGDASANGIIQERRDYIDYNSCAGHASDPVCIAFWDFTNNKKLGYTAYTYPHPLVGAIASGSQHPRLRLRSAVDFWPEFFAMFLTSGVSDHASINSGSR